MPGMLHLCDVFEFIIDSFYNGSFPEKEFVRDWVVFRKFK